MTLTPASCALSTVCSDLSGETLVILYRGQGVGTAILKQLMASPAASQKDVYLTTLAGTTAFYQKAGFAVVPAKEVPR